MQLIRGQKIKLLDVLPSSQFFIHVNVQSPFITDVSLFGLDGANRLSNESYLIFYNQPSSPCGAVRLTQNTQTSSQFSLDLQRLPSSIVKLVVTLTIDGNDVMRNLGASSVSILTEHGQTVTTFALTGSMFANERAVMALEVYQKQGIWRFGAVGQGFEGGLATLIEFFGGEVAKDIPQTPASPVYPQTHTPQVSTPPVSIPQAPTPSPYLPQSPSQSASATSLDLKKRLSLEKAQKTGNASIIDLTKKSLIQLEKQGLLDVKAKVALVLDASGSMNWQYRNGDVQKIVNRLMPLAINFDDDGSFECWAFANATVQLDDVTLYNVNDFVNQTHQGWERWRVGARLNNEITAIESVINYYYPHQAGFKGGFWDRVFNPQPIPIRTQAPIKNDLPIYVLFISDGGVGSGRQMQKILTDCANLPIFWQFVGVGGQDYGILEKLDTMTGRVVDNCGFFELDNIGSVSDDRLYELLLQEFPKWLTHAKRQGIIR